MVDLSTMHEDWLTKQEAARILQVAEKTIDRLADRGELQKATRKRPGLPPVAVFHPDDVERARKVREIPARPFMFPPAVGPVVDVSAQQSDTDVRPVQESSIVPVQAVSDLSSVLDVIGLRYAPPLWLTRDQAVAYSGLSLTYLKKAVKWHDIGAGGFVVCRREDLDKL